MAPQRSRRPGAMVFSVGTKERKGMLKKWLVWAGIAFIVFFVAFRPGAAGEVVSNLGHTATDILIGVGDFFDSLVGR